VYPRSRPKGRRQSEIAFAENPARLPGIELLSDVSGLCGSERAAVMLMLLQSASSTTRSLLCISLAARSRMRS
jgi:hypothetical protein